MRFGSLVVSAMTLSLCCSGIGCVTSDQYHHESAEHYAHAGPPVQYQHHEGQYDQEQKEHQEKEHQEKEHQQYEQHQ